jgi:hypothetical protein
MPGCGITSTARPGRAGVSEFHRGGHESPERVAASFLEAAGRLAENWRTEPERSYELPIVLPILQNYRHAIELILKAACLRIQKL